jgi:NitT/TauT family transport system permease protein/taurine transport system permease protein
MSALRQALDHRAVQEWWLLALVLLAWAAASATGWMPTAVFPDLQSLFATGKQLLTGEGGALGALGDHVGASVVRFAMGYALSVVVGIALGLVMAASGVAAALMLPVLRFLYPIPGLAWTPLVIMWAGLGETTVVVLIFLSAVWPVLYGSYDGFRNIPAPYLRVSRQLGSTWPMRVRKVLIPAALPILISSMRISHGIGWRAIIGAEMIAALSGLGFMLNLGGELRRPDVVVLGMVVIAVISVIFDRLLFDPMERRLAKKGLR